MSRAEGSRAVAAAVAVVCAAFVFFPAPAPGGLAGSPHDLSSTNSLYSSTPIAKQGVCSGCHVPHAAQYQYLWPRNLLPTYDNAFLMNGGSGAPSDIPNYKRSVTVPCYDCHDAHVTTNTVEITPVPDFNAFATNHKPQNIAFGFRKGGTTDPGSTMAENRPGSTVPGYYENTPPYDNIPSTYFGANASATSPFKPRSTMDNATLARSGGHYFKTADPKTGSVYRGDKLACSECHDPHVWDSQWQAFFRPPKLYGSVRWTTVFGLSKPKASQYMANPTLIMASLRNNQESRNLCIVCHGDATSVDSITYNDMNSDYNSTKIVRTPLNTPDGTLIAEHGSGSTAACVSCHNHGSVATSCAACHSFPDLDNSVSARQMSRGHWDHVGQPSPAGKASSKAFNCRVCHLANDHNQSNLGVGETWSGYNPATVNINFDNAWNPQNARGPKYAGASMPAAGVGGTGTCDGLYCHGNGSGQSDWGGTTAALLPRWDNTAPCGSCHAAGAPLPQGNHPVHLDNATKPYGPGGLAVFSGSGNCADGVGCHLPYGLSPASTHVDNAVSMRMSTDNSLAQTTVCAGCHATATAAYDNGIGSGVGNTLARQYWNDNNYRLPCLTCHNKTLPAVDNIVTGNPAPNIETHWLVTGHGATVIDNVSRSSNNVGVDPPVYQTVPVPCGGCHDVNSRHFGRSGKNASNPWRLRSTIDLNNAAGAFDRWCAERCHFTGPPADHAYNVMAGTTRAMKNSWDTHPTSDNAAAATIMGAVQAPPATMPLQGVLKTKGLAPTDSQNFLCVSCHDPHGTGTAAASPRTYTGYIQSTADNVHMLRFNYEENVGDNEYRSQLCTSCHL